MVKRVAIDDHEIDAVALYQPLPWFLRLDVLPFAFLYTTAMYLYAIRSVEDMIISVFVAGIVLVHGLTFLSAEWSVDADCWVSYTTAYDVQWDSQTIVYVKVFPSRLTLSKQLCRCHIADSSARTKNQLSSGEKLPLAWFSYQNVHFCFYNDTLDCVQNQDDATVCFRRMDFPTQRTIKSYIASDGYTSTEELVLASLKWGKNDFDIPIPTFVVLLKEQLVAPFFVFQFFCMLLWCLDEYVYYSMLTLVMLVIFECTVVKQRQRNMEMLNQMRRTPQSCLVYRSKKWISIWSDGLVPGDICSIGTNDMGSERETTVPCDLLLLTGNCVVNESMLSGESIPLRKESISYGMDADKMIETLEVDESTSMRHKKYVLFGGTKILQHTLVGSTPISITSKLRIPDAPDGGCIAFVLRTGFGTTQGSLIRTILYASQRVTANNAEAMWFILFLLAFALFASGFVLYHGLQDPLRDRFKLILHCIMITTSVVPPELPMELSLAVTNSLIALTKVNIFCTEPFRIPFAGRIDVCCFDKTGTLTSDELKMHGVAGLETHVKESDSSRKHHGELDIVAPELLPLDTELVLAGCQSLVLLNGQTVGDPLELTALQNIKWSLVYCQGYGGTGYSAQPSFYSDRRGVVQSIDILHSYAFSSDLKRMTTIVSVIKTDNEEPDERRVLTKGAPEVVEQFLIKKPTYYRRVYRHFASKGCRVLALGYRILPTDCLLDELRLKSRQEFEKELTFAGFLVLDCPLKKDTKRTIRDLVTAKHKVIMVTGDNELTACDVACQVGINIGYSKDTLVLTALADKGLVEWNYVDDGSPDMEIESIPFKLVDVAKLQSRYDLCVTGDALKMLLTQQESVNKDEGVALERYLQVLEQLCPYINVFARTSPQQKEHIILAMNRSGKTTAMCGDGTNDVGALKQAHIGISIVNASSTNNARSSLFSGLSSAERGAFNRDGLRQRGLSGQQQRFPRDEYKGLLQDEDTYIVRLGDASIASPFTSKSSSIRVTKQLIRQGRCTLVTTIQMYKILGVNCLITAYYLSSLFMHGVKNGDQQLTLSGLIIAAFFFFLSRTKPAKKLSDRRPPQGVFCMSVMVSILGQFAIHLAFLAATLHFAQPFADRSDPSMHPDGQYSPNIINSVMFLMATIIQVSTFVVNYQGQPFMESFSANKGLCRSTLMVYAILLMAVSEVFPPVNEMLDLVPFPNTEMQTIVFGLMVGDTCATLLFEYIVQQISSILA